MEKKKKGKRKSETTVESLELDQGLPNPSLRSPEESTESTDSQVQLWPGVLVEVVAARWDLADAGPVVLSPSLKPASLVHRSGLGFHCFGR